MRICKVKATKRVIEMQTDATPGTLLKNALNAGYTLDAVEELDVDAPGYAAALAEDPVEIALKAKLQADAQAKAAAKAKIVLLEADVPKAKTLAELQASVAELINCVKVLT